MNINTYFAAIAIVLGSGVISVLGLLAARKVVKFEKLRPSHEVSGYLLSVVATLYSVLTGLIVVDAMQYYQHAREITERESDNLADVYILAKRLPPPEKTKIRNLCKQYLSRVVDTEWELMSCGSYCPVAQEQAVDLMQALIDFEPKTEAQKDLYPQMVQEASQFWQNRQSRIGMARKGVPLVEWATLIAGALITVFFTYLFGLENTGLQLIMTSMVAMLIALVMALFVLYAFPFSGDLAIQSDTFQQVKEIFETN